MSLFKKLFGKNSAPTVEVVEYAGFRITASPIAEGNAYRLCAVIEKELGGETKSHTLVRADTIAGKEAAEDASVRKAKQVIDEQGDRIFS